MIDTLDIHDDSLWVPQVPSNLITHTDNGSNTVSEIEPFTGLPMGTTVGSDDQACLF